MSASMRILIACEFSGVVREAFAAKGHEVWSCDLLPTELPGNHYQGDIFDILYEEWDMMIAFPPCTYLTVSGNKWFKPEYATRFPGRRKQQEDGIKFFLALANAPIHHIAIENPVGVMSSVFRKPDQIIEPYQFGFPTTKKTCLWLQNLPPLQPTNIVEPEWHVTKTGNRYPKWSMIDACKYPVGAARSKFRSRTFQGVAEAMAAQWDYPANYQNSLF